MITVVRAFGRLAILQSLAALTIGLAILANILIDRLTYQSRDLNHLLKHSFGNLGVFMVVFSLAGYVLKKYTKSLPGKVKDWLSIHQVFSITGAVFIGIHTGGHLNALIPSLCFILTVICVMSGLAGRHIYMKSQTELSARRKKLINEGLSDNEVDEILAIAIAATKTMSKWRSIHRPMTLTLGILVAWHIVTVLYYGG